MLLEGNDTTKNVTITLTLKYCNNFWKTLDMPLINCEVSLILTWSINCAITSRVTRNDDPDVDPSVAAIYNPTGATLAI